MNSRLLEQLIEEYNQSPGQDTLKELLRYFRPYILHWASLYIKDKYLQEDICQDVSLKLARQLPDMKDLNALPAWVKRVTRNRCIDYLRKKENQHQNLSAEHLLLNPALTYHIDHLESGDALQQLIQTLPDKAQQIVIDHYLLEKDIHTIAYSNGEKASNIYNILSRARKRLTSQRLETGFEQITAYCQRHGLASSHSLDKPISQSPYTTFVHTFSTLLNYDNEQHYSIADIAGYTGQAFRIHFSTIGEHEMSPYIFHWSSVARQSFALLGYTSLCFGYPRYPEVKLERTLEAVKQISHSIVAGFPVIVWNLSPNEFSLIYGYNHEGQYFIYADVSNRSKQISYLDFHELTTKQELFFAILKGRLHHFQKTPQLKATFQHITNHLTGHEPEIEGNVSGLKAYLEWISAIQENRLEALAHAYAIANYHEWRRLALEWLNNLLDKPDIPNNMHLLIKELAMIYTEICKLYQLIYPRFPASRHLYEAEERHLTLSSLATIYELESSAVKIAKKIVNQVID